MLSHLQTKKKSYSRDSNFWSDVSSIGPSVSAAGSLHEDDLDVPRNRKESNVIVAIIFSKNDPAYLEMSSLGIHTKLLMISSFVKN